MVRPASGWLAEEGKRPPSVLAEMDTVVRYSQIGEEKHSYRAGQSLTQSADCDLLSHRSATILPKWLPRVADTRAPSLPTELPA